MCGIFTAIYKNKDKLNLDFCNSSTDQLKKRGPDWSFSKTIGKIFFGQTVLSMSGKKQKSIQDHISNSQRFMILFNGEIYNFRFLREKYSLKIDKNSSDTKVLVNLFDRLPIKQIINELDGMYAFVLYDNLKNKIYFSRDIQGEKSLYFYEDNEKILISSEISTFLNSNCNVKIDKEGLQNYLNSRHYLQLRRSSYSKIKNILPGETIEINLKTFDKKTLFRKDMSEYVCEKSYFNNKTKTLEELAYELETLLIKNLVQMSPEKRKYCSILSGGVDSTLISKLLENNSNPSFFLTLNHVGKDKISNQINRFKKFFKNEIKIVNVNLENYYSKLKSSIRVCSSPIASHDFPGKLILAEEAKKRKCKAIFGGDGADEIFGGYKTYLQKINNFKINNSDYSMYKKNELKFSKINNKDFKIQLSKYWNKCLKAYCFLDKDEKNRQAMMLSDAALQLSSVGLRGNDLMFMNHSVEPRSIFLRRDILKFALNLPIEFKVNFEKNDNLNTKIILKKIFLKYFPKKLLFKKQGFSGFPNETLKFLTKPKNFLINKFIIPKKKINKFSDLDNTTKWKILNYEHFYKEEFSRIN